MRFLLVGCMLSIIALRQIIGICKNWYWQVPLTKKLEIEINQENCNQCNYYNYKIYFWGVWESIQTVAPWRQDNNYSVDLSFEYFILSFCRCEQAGVGTSASRQMVQKTLWATADPVCLHMFGAFQKRLCLCSTPAPLDRDSHHLDLVVTWLDKKRSPESCKASISMIILSLKMSVSAENTVYITVYNIATAMLIFIEVFFITRTNNV